jgi:CRP-like cAMP-binding protein
MSNAAAAQLEKVAERLLANVRFFRGLNKADVFAFLLKSARANFKAGEPIFREGDAEQQSMFIIVKGSVELTKHSADGKDDVIDTLAVGQCFGEMALIDSHPRSATAVAKEECICLICDAGTLAAFQAVAFKIYENLARIVAVRYLDAEAQMRTRLNKPACHAICFPQITKNLPPVEATISPEVLAALATLGDPYAVPANNFVIKENTFGQYMYVVKEGELEMRTKVATEATVIATLKDSGHFGEVALVSEEHGRSADVFALTDTKLVRLNAVHLQRSPAIGAIAYREIARVFSMNLRRSTHIYVRTIGRRCYAECMM